MAAISMSKQIASTIGYSIFLFSILFSYSTCDGFRCQSCFAGCRSLDDCDCEGRDLNDTCSAPYCYVKLEYFADDGYSAVQKGCTNEISSTYSGCQYASDDRSIACFCSGDYCNSALNLSRYDTPDLPLITCCQCNDDETGQEQCYPQNCTRNCTGNYCYLDMVANAQGCGWGHPQLFHFLRSQKYLRWSNELTCAEYYDNYRNYMSGCTCSSDNCNVVQDLEQLKTRRRIQSEQKNVHFCHSLYAHSETAFGAEVYRHASMCPSYFCFISWTSVEVVVDQMDEFDDDFQQGGELGSGETETAYSSSMSKRNSMLSLRSTYEISAGCLLVDDEEKVQIGCTTEWSQNERSPLTKHCICSTKLCNDFDLIHGDMPRAKIDHQNGRPPYRDGSLAGVTTTISTSTASEISTSTESAATTNQNSNLESQTFVAVTSAYVTSPITESIVEDRIATKIEFATSSSPPPPRPPSGQFRPHVASSAATIIRNTSARRLFSVVFVFIYLSYFVRTAVFE